MYCFHCESLCLSWLEYIDEVMIITSTAQTSDEKLSNNVDVCDRAYQPHLHHARD